LQSGWLFKANHHTGTLSSALAGKWKKHWFALTPSALSYYEDDTSRAESVGRPMPQVVIPLKPGAMRVSMASEHELELLPLPPALTHVISIKYHHHTTGAHRSEERGMEGRDLQHADFSAHRGKQRKLEKFCLRALNASDCEVWNNALSRILSEVTVAGLAAAGMDSASTPERATVAGSSTMPGESSEAVLDQANSTITVAAEEVVAKEGIKDFDEIEGEEGEFAAQGGLEEGEPLLASESVHGGAAFEEPGINQVRNAQPEEGAVENIGASEGGLAQTAANELVEAPELIDEPVTPEIPEIADGSRSLSSDED